MKTTAPKITPLKKGSEFYVVQSFNDHDTSSYRHVRVHSCGQKQMALIDTTTGECIGRSYWPAHAGLDVQVLPRVVWAVTYYFGDDPEAFALAHAAQYAIDRIARLEGMIERQPTADPRYLNSLRESIAKFQAAEPKTVNRTGSGRY